MNSNTALRHSIHAALERDAVVNLHAASIGIRVDGSEVLLEGEVPEIGAKRRAFFDALGVEGVSAVEDRLRITVTNGQGEARLRDAVVEALYGEPVFRRTTVFAKRAGGGESAQAQDGGLIEVSATGGVVRLDGRVPSLTHRRFAEVLAWWIPGTADVDNRLHVEPPEDDSDGEITDAVTMVLEKDPMIEASQVRVTVRERQVTLEGVVRTESQRQRVARDAWYVLGVHEVINRIRVGP
ncbi:MAG: BON domain-containing protein, partial [Gammaproteobacteria bacterium]